MNKVFFGFICIVFFLVEGKVMIIIIGNGGKVFIFVLLEFSLEKVLIIFLLLFNCFFVFVIFWFIFDEIFLVVNVCCFVFLGV